MSNLVVWVPPDDWEDCTEVIEVFGGREITLRAVEADGISSGGEWLPAIVYVLVEEA